MDVRYKTFANRTSQDLRFDQLLRAKPISTHTSQNNLTPPLISKTNFSQFGCRKKVNVVSFTPGTDGQELITKSPEKPRTSDSSVKQQVDSFCVDATAHPLLLYESSEAFATGAPVVNSSSVSLKVSANTPVVCSPSKDKSGERGFSTVLNVANQNTKPRRGQPGCTGLSIASQPEVSPPVSASVDRCNRSKSMSYVVTPLSSAQSTLNNTQISKLSFGDRYRSLTATKHMQARGSKSTNSASGGQQDKILPCKPVSLSHSPTVSVQSALAACTNEDTMAKRPAHTFLYGKNKRAAYNPRPWQQEVYPEEGSPTKMPKILATQSDPATTGLLQKKQVLSSKTLPELAAQSKQPQKTSESHENLVNAPSLCRSVSVPTGPSKPCGFSSGVRRNFDFPDSDDEETKTVLPRKQLPKLTSLMVGTATLSQKSKSSDGTPPCTIPQISDDSKAETNEEEDTEDLEDDEEDDVKPWFCPPERRLPEKRSKPSSTKANENRVSRTEKPLYTVVHNVKEAHICQERGETQQLLDDVEYLIDGLADHNQISTRSLSVLTLANRCLTASFRYLVNAHGLIRRICANLHDAYKDYTLALTSAGLFFILSRDRNPNMLDADSLPIVLKLFSAPDSILVNNGGISCVSKVNKEAERVRTRVRQLLEGLQQHQQSARQQTRPTGPNHTELQSENSTSLGQSVNNPVKRSSSQTSCLPPIVKVTSLTAGTAGLNTRHLQMTRQLTAADLILEAILNLGTRKSAEWFKAELRNGGGLDRVADAAADAVDYLADLDPDNSDDCRSRRPNRVWRSTFNPTGLDGFALDRLKRVCHYTKLLENMTYMNSDNQTYLVRYRDQLLVNQLLRCVRLCASHLPKQVTETVSQTLKPTENSKAGPATSIIPGAPKQPSDQCILVDCVLGVLRFLVNVSHNEFASDRLGGCPGLLETILECLLNLPPRLPKHKRFDLLVLALCLLVNLCEHCPENRTRLVHLDIPKPIQHKSPNSSIDADATLVADKEGDAEADDDEEEEDDEVFPRRTPLTSALDELIQLFLIREERARNHDFERDDEDADTAEARRRERANADKQADCAPGFGRPTHVEEAGLKWRLIEDRKALGFSAGECFGSSSSKRKRRRLELRQRRCEERKLVLARARHHSSSDEEEEEEDDEVSEAEEEDLDDELDEELDEDEEEDDDDESVGSGADVEFVADTQEEQEKLAERMCQAQQHMEDSVVAAYAALLLGCILQSSPRYTERIRSKLPDGQFRPLAIMLAKLLSFLSLTKGVGSSGSESILRIVRILEAQDKPSTGTSSSTASVPAT
ncbi:unnamed protein product [Calicophoron daubneyi]|uniref:WAPL domain-containing protein n=1 Tax=Calicophoron daubneyi TaxID=300641 RepID=A0AAV2TD22_CALDB